MARGRSAGRASRATPSARRRSCALNPCNTAAPAGAPACPAATEDPGSSTASSRSRSSHSGGTPPFSSPRSRRSPPFTVIRPPLAVAPGGGAVLTAVAASPVRRQWSRPSWRERRRLVLEAGLAALDQQDRVAGAEEARQRPLDLDPLPRLHDGGLGRKLLIHDVGEARVEHRDLAEHLGAEIRRGLHHAGRRDGSGASQTAAHAGDRSGAACRYRENTPGSGVGTVAGGAWLPRSAAARWSRSSLPPATIRTCWRAGARRCARRRRARPASGGRSAGKPPARAPRRRGSDRWRPASPWSRRSCCQRRSRWSRDRVARPPDRPPPNSKRRPPPDSRRRADCLPNRSSATRFPPPRREGATSAATSCPAPRRRPTAPRRCSADTTRFDRGLANGVVTGSPTARAASTLAGGTVRARSRSPAASVHPSCCNLALKAGSDETFAGPRGSCAGSEYQPQTRYAIGPAFTSFRSS